MMMCAKKSLGFIRTMKHDSITSIKPAPGDANQCWQALAQWLPDAGINVVLTHGMLV